MTLISPTTTITNLTFWNNIDIYWTILSFGDSAVLGDQITKLFASLDRKIDFFILIQSLCLTLLLQFQKEILQNFFDLQCSINSR